MLDSQKLNEISLKIKEIVDSSPLADVEKNLHALFKGMLTRMELVSREEFDSQAKTLKSIQEKLNTLEAKLAEIEASADKAAAQS